MRSLDEQQGSLEGSTYRELKLLTEVEAAPEATQRELAQRVGIALGLTNVLLRNLAQKGYIRATQAHWKRWLYALTPDGFAHKISLTVAYVQRVLYDYQRVRQTLREQLAPLALHEESSVAIYGTGEFAELVYLGLRELGIDDIDIFGPDGSNRVYFLGISVKNLSHMAPEKYDRVVVATLGESETISAELQQQGASPEKVVTFFADGTAKEHD